MKKTFTIIFIAACLLSNFIEVKAQSISFTPQNNQVIVCSSTNQTFNLFYSSSLSPYPPLVTVAAFAKLTTPDNTYYANIMNTNMGSFPQQFTLPSGTYTWTMELYENFLGESTFKRTATVTNTFYLKYQISAANNFTGGTINFDGKNNVTCGTQDSQTLKLVGENVSVGAIDQNDGANYYRVWNTNGTNNSNWRINNNSIVGATPRNYSYTVQSGDYSATLIADLKKVCNLTFVNNVSNIYVDGYTYSSPKNADVIEQNSVTAYGQGATNNGLDYTFDHWVSNNQSFGSTITPSAHGTYTAFYTARPSNASKNFGSPSAVNRPIVITWADNSNTAVDQYQIWRRVKHNGVMGSPVLLTSVGRGVQTYTDYEYAKTNGYTNDLILYDVRQYYSTEGTYSVEDWNTLFGQQWIKATESNNSMNMEMEKPTTYSIGNYPNPFNPTTVINYQLPENGFVTIKVYDMLGKEVAALVNEQKSAGYHKATFDASKLTSGVYIYTISVNNFTQSKKMMLTK